MLHYSRIAELLQKKFNCIIQNVYGNTTIEYISFKTSDDILCFLHIPKQYEITLDGINLKLMKRWTKPKETFEAKLAKLNINSGLEENPDIPIVNMIQAKNCPNGYIKFLLKLEPSLVSVPYKIGLLTQEFILITSEPYENMQREAQPSIEKPDSSGVLTVEIKPNIDIYVHNGTKHPQLLLVFDVETLIHNNVMLEIKRVYNKIFQLISQYTESYYIDLAKLLQKCQHLKLISKGKTQTDKLTDLERVVFCDLSHSAIKLALQYYSDVSELNE